MTFQDLIYLAAMAWIPTVISVIMFRRAPGDRPFLLTFVLAVIGSSFAYTMIAIVSLAVGGLGLGMFDGLTEFILSIPIAFIAGLTVRAKRQRHLFSRGY